MTIRKWKKKNVKVVKNKKKKIVKFFMLLWPKIEKNRLQDIALHWVFALHGNSGYSAKRPPA